MIALLLLAALASPAPEAAVRFECVRCHEAPDLAAAPPDKQCVGCHQRILAGTFEAEADLLQRWQRRLTSLNHAPDLRGARRLRRSWIASYLLRPFDVRPELPATMPRLALTPADAEALAAWLAPPDADGTPPPGDATRGALRFMQLGCLACHLFTGATLPDVALAGPIPFPPAEVIRGRPRAPDLTWTRDRMTPAAAIAWLQDPTAFVPDSPMAAYRANDEDARDLVAFLFQARLLQPPPPPIPATPAPLDRPVRWPEVEERVFKHVCWHCHSDPAYALGDGGPGNTGGFGFAPRRLNLASATGVASGLLDATTSQRRSSVHPRPRRCHATAGGCAHGPPRRGGRPPGPWRARHAARPPASPPRRHPARRHLGRPGPPALSAGRDECPRLRRVGGASAASAARPSQDDTMRIPMISLAFLALPLVACDDDGGGGGGTTVSSGVETEKVVSDLSDAEGQQICDAAANKTASVITPARACTAILAAFSPDAQTCRNAISDCVQEFTSEPATDEECLLADATKREGCAATVAEVEGCLSAAIGAASTALARVSCNDAGNAQKLEQILASSPSGPQDVPACASVVEKCPDIFPADDDDFGPDASLPEQ
ncbi:MAG: hypothetical protein R3F60_27590 [bacterium]